MSDVDRQPLDSGQARDPAAFPETGRDGNSLPPVSDEQQIPEDLVDAGLEAAADDQAANAQDPAEDEEDTAR
ncbi:MAG: hypothetical protein Q7P63_04480 [Verrucomicrobiota bacterium JB022]|nr:hypothetical protein [Verrucomicrobiota bacterium JB022]